MFCPRQDVLAQVAYEREKHSTWWRDRRVTNTAARVICVGSWKAAGCPEAVGRCETMDQARTLGNAR